MIFTPCVRDGMYVSDTPDTLRLRTGTTGGAISRFSGKNRLVFLSRGTPSFFVPQIFSVGERSRGTYRLSHPGFITGAGPATDSPPRPITQTPSRPDFSTR